MALLKFVVPDEIDQYFRKTAMERFGYSKGSLSKAAEEALYLWIDHAGEFGDEVRSIGNPIKAISGMLRNVPKTSVQLQQEIKFIRSEKYVRDRC